MKSREGSKEMEGEMQSLVQIQKSIGIRDVLVSASYLILVLQKSKFGGCASGTVFFVFNFFFCFSN